MASAGTFMASTTLTRPTVILQGPYKHSQDSATISRPLMALSLAKQSLLLSLQALLWPLHALSRILQTLSCEILTIFLQKIYFSCSYSSKTFLKGHERAFRGHESAKRLC